MIRGPKGDDGPQGPQGPMGPPCDCSCVSFNNYNIRFIYEGGNHTISDSDTTIIISSDSECILYLPEIVKNIKEFQHDVKDYYVKYPTKKIVIQRGHHSIKTLTHVKDLINDSYYSANLVPNKIYEIVPTKDGWIVI